MPLEFPDWLRGLALVGKSGVNFVPVAVDSDGNMFVLMQGSDGVTLRPVKLDSEGRIIGTLIDPDSGNYVAVNASGFLTTILKGLGADAALHTISVDNAGQIIMVPRGASGNYMNVDANGFLASVMKGNDAGTLRTVAVDASGNIIGVLKGDYGGALATIKVDSEGRIFAYLQDGQDQWGNILVGGLAELATRLGSVVSYERRGQVLLVENFSNGLGFYTTTASGTGTVELSPAKYYKGGYSVKMSPQSAAGNTCNLSGQIGSVPVGQRVGLGVWISYVAGLESVKIVLIVGDGSNQNISRIELEYSTGKVYAYTTAAARTEVGRFETNAATLGSFRFVKFVINLSTARYVRVIVDDTQFDASAVSFQQNPTSIKYCSITILVQSDGTRYGPLYVGAVILTSVEPAN
jgi:hypothetical protein